MTSEVQQGAEAPARGRRQGSVDPEDARKKRSKSVKLFIRDILLILLAALLISFLIKTFLIRSFYIPSGSMEDTLHINDRIIVNELVPNLVELNHGDVVVFRDPGGWRPSTPVPDRGAFVEGVDAVLGFIGLSAPDSNDHLIKRVIGMPGDVVICCNDFGQLTVNGVPLDEPYIKLIDGVTKATRNDFKVVVPEGHMWVMGDNRYNSADSAYHYANNDPGGGMVPIDHVVGRAFLVSWPTENWAWLDNYPLTFEGVEEAK